MAKPKSALSAYQKALRARKQLEEPNSPPIADIYDSIACSYTELGMVSEAFEYLSKAADIHHAHNPLHMARTKAIYAMTHLRAEQPQEAQESLLHCWRLQGLTEDQVTHSKYPKHSGDIILLARIKYALGLKEEAQQLASRTISIRRGLYGNKGPRVADSLFLVAQMLQSDGEAVLAAKLLRTVVEASEDVLEMQGHLARALWFLAGAENEIGDKNRAEELRLEAKTVRDKIRGTEAITEDTDESFMNLVGWMLW
jgi:tetratricopeptide (TPR) repeat protein